MRTRDFTREHARRSHDGSIPLVGPDVRFEVEIVFIGQQTRIEVDGVGEIGPRDVEVAAAVGIGGEVAGGEVLAWWDDGGWAHEAVAGQYLPSRAFSGMRVEVLLTH